MIRKIIRFTIPVIACISICSCSSTVLANNTVSTSEIEPTSMAEKQTEDIVSLEKGTAFSLSDIPEYTTSPYYVVNDNVPYFSDDDLTTNSFEYYSELDVLGRCGTAYASIGVDLMPTEKRGNIGQVKPTGWHTVKYDFVDGKYLYNRCHLIGYQLTGENANEKNLITGTRYLNVDGMLPFENMVADYIKETNNHVMYRVTPIFDGNNLVASGVLMEGESVEDHGDAIMFCMYVYNVQPGVTIDYATGESQLATNSNETHDTGTTQNGQKDSNLTSYVLNTKSKKFHIETCSSVRSMNPKNKQTYIGNRDDLLADGYSPCGICHP